VYFSHNHVRLPRVHTGGQPRCAFGRTQMRYRIGARLIDSAE